MQIFELNNKNMISTTTLNHRTTGTLMHQIFLKLINSKVPYVIAPLIRLGKARITVYVSISVAVLYQLRIDLEFTSPMIY